MYPPIGLLFSREEFAEAVNRFPSRDCDFICVDQDFRETIFEWTLGHASAIEHLLNKLCDVVSPHRYVIVKHFPNRHTSVAQKITRWRNTHR
jgi:hypothetical protein